MSSYNQVGQGELDQKQQGNKLGAGQNPSPKPGGQDSLPDEGDPKGHRHNEPGKDNASGPEEGLPHQLPGGESG